MNKTIIIVSFISLIILGILLYAFANNRRIDYYAIDEINTYLAVDSDNIYLNASPYKISSRSRKAWNCWIKKNGKEPTCLLFPQGTGNIVAVHTDALVGHARVNPWLIWLPSNVDKDRFPYIIVDGFSVTSNHLKISQLKQKDLNKRPERWPVPLGEEAAEEVAWFLNVINAPKNYTKIEVIKEDRYCLTVRLSNGDYIKCDEKPCGDDYVSFPVFLCSELFPSTVIMNRQGTPEFHCKETFVLEYGGSEYAGFEDDGLKYPPYNTYFLGSPFERYDLFDYYRSKVQQ